MAKKSKSKGKGPDQKKVSGAAKRLRNSSASKQDRTDASETINFAKGAKAKRKGGK